MNPAVYYYHSYLASCHTVVLFGSFERTPVWKREVISLKNVLINVSFIHSIHGHCCKQFHVGFISLPYVHRRNPPPYEEEAVRANGRRLLNQCFN